MAQPSTRFQAEPVLSQAGRAVTVLAYTCGTAGPRAPTGNHPTSSWCRLSADRLVASVLVVSQHSPFLRRLEQTAAPVIGNTVCQACAFLGAFPVMITKPTLHSAAGEMSHLTYSNMTCSIPAYWGLGGCVCLVVTSSVYRVACELCCISLAPFSLGALSCLCLQSS